MSSRIAANLLAELCLRGIEVLAEGDRLRYRPRSKMTPELTERVRRHKGDLIAIIRAAGPFSTVCADDLPAEWRELYEERAGIRQYDGQQNRANAERLALLEVVIQMRVVDAPDEPS